MAERKEKELLSQEEAAEAKRKKHPLLRLFLILAVVLSVVVVALALDGSGFDGLRRIFTYSTLEKDETGLVSLFTFDADSENQYAAVGDSLLLLSENHLILLDEEGKEIYRQNQGYEQPVLSCWGDRAVVYSVGGSQVQVLDEKGLCWELSDLKGVVAARVNTDGYLAVVDRKDGYKNTVSVYSEKGTKLFDYNSSSRYLLDACVTGDNRYVAMVALGQENGSFISQILMYELSSAEQSGSCILQDQMILDMMDSGNGVLTLSENAISVLKADGQLQAQEDFSRAYLRKYSLQGEDFVAVFLGRYKSGSMGELLSYDSAGEEIARLEVSEEILDLSARGKYLAVLYLDRLVIYTRDLQEYSVLSGTEFARYVSMRSDGSALLLSSSQAWLYLP